MSAPIKTGTVTTTVYYDSLGPEEVYKVATASLYRDRPFDLKQVSVSDIRGRENDFTLDRQGFELHQHDIVFDKFDDDERVKDEFWVAVSELLKAKTGAKKVVPFSHIARTQTYESVEKSAQDGPADKPVAGLHPARWVHVDHSSKGAEVIGQDVFTDAWPELSTSRWQIINVWIPISPIVRRDPLGIVDRTTVDHADLVPKALQIPGPRAGSAFSSSGKGNHQICGVKWNPDHRWYWCSGMKTEEALFIRIFDSRDDGGVHGVPHTSFVVPGTEAEEKRQSIETRCFGKCGTFGAVDDD